MCSQTGALKVEPVFGAWSCVAAYVWSHYSEFGFEPFRRLLPGLATLEAAEALSKEGPPVADSRFRVFVGVVVRDLRSGDFPEGAQYEALAGHGLLESRGVQFRAKPGTSSGTRPASRACGLHAAIYLCGLAGFLIGIPDKPEAFAL